MKRMMKLLSALFVAVCILMTSVSEANAVTVYGTDDIEHEEGYIIVGESHVVLTMNAYAQSIDSEGYVAGLEDVQFFFNWDDSLSVTEDGAPNTFLMSSNLFFVVEGNIVAEGEKQKNKSYIYSDGQGNHGAGVEKIHNIMETNPNIKHWNIISFQGAVSALEGSVAGKYYVNSYRNWIDYEFPEADIYIVSHATMTKFYRQSKVAGEFDKELKKAFPERFLDYTAFFKERYPDQMLDPDQKPDSIHWNNDTYISLFNDIITKIQSGEYDCNKETEGV